MQDQVNEKVVAVSIKTTKLTASVLQAAIKQVLAKMKAQRGKQPRGKQTLKQLMNQNTGISNIEITDKNIKAFTAVAKKYHVDFALKKDTTAEKPRYMVFFKSRDADAITAAFQEFAAKKMAREEKPTIRERLAKAKEKAAQRAEQRTIDREKVKVKDRSVQL